MNILAPPRARLQIEVVFDLVCPWCYLGTRRLRRALRARPDIVVVFGADHVYRMDPAQMIEAHLARGAGVTVDTPR